MPSTDKMRSFISLILRRFAKSKNLDGEYRSIEQAAIPTITMVAEWARDERTDVSEVWLFGSAVGGESWDGLKDDLDILLVIPDKLWKPDDERLIPREIPLSDHYLPLDVRVRRESDCEPWRTQALANLPTAPHEEGEKFTVAEYAMRQGVCVWRRDKSENSGEEDESNSLESPKAGN